MKSGTVVAFILLFTNIGRGTALGGPDAFGYYWESTQDPGDTVRFFWIDPTAHQVIPEWNPDPDDGWASVNLPGGFFFYGETLWQINVCTNGFLQFPTNFTTYRNPPLPVGWCWSLIAVFWDDLSPLQSGDVRFAHDVQAGFTVISWSNVVRYNTGETLSCQVLLYTDGRIRLNYLRIPAGANSSTIGIQGCSGNDGNWLQYVYNGQPPVHIPDDSTSIIFFVRRLEYDVGINTALSPRGWVPTGGQVPVAASIRNFGLTPVSFPVRALILRSDWPADTLFDRYGEVTNLAPADTTTCYLGDFISPPSPDSWAVEFITCLVRDQYSRNDTCRVGASSVIPVFGTVLNSSEFPELGDGLNLLGITCCQESARFYFCVTDPNRVFSFPASRPREGIRQEPFELQNFFGDDIVWGICWHSRLSGFWLTHISEASRRCILARYDVQGSFTGDTWDLSAIEPGVWFAGLDQDEEGMLWATGVGSHNRLYRLDPLTRAIREFLPGQMLSYRACSFLGSRQGFLFSGGWNSRSLVKLDRTGNVLETVSFSDLADLDIFQTGIVSPDSLVWAYATRNNEWNTISRVCLGMTWGQVGLGEIALSPSKQDSCFVVPNPLRSQNFMAMCRSSSAKFDLFDVTGRRRFRTVSRPAGLSPSDLQWCQLTPGVYLLRLSPESSRTFKLVILAK